MLEIKTRCTAAWDKMDQLADGNRFCHDCKKVVHDLTARSAAEGLKLYNDLGGSMCARMVNPEYEAKQQSSQQNSGYRLRLNMAQLRVAASAAAFVLLSQSPLMAQGAPILSSALNKDGKPMQEVQAIEEGVFIFGGIDAHEPIEGLQQLQNQQNSDPSGNEGNKLPEDPNPANSHEDTQAEWKRPHDNTIPASPTIVWETTLNIENMILGWASGGIVYLLPEEARVQELNLAVIPYELLPLAIPLNEYDPRPLGHLQETPEKERPLPSPYFLAGAAVPLRRRRYRPRKASQNA